MDKKNKSSPKREESLSLLKKNLEDREYEFADYEYPKATIILPTYNSSQLISITIESVIDQQYPDFELVVIDGGSLDRTVEIIKSLKNDRIKVFSIAGNKRYELINKGIAQAEGQYISILFPGDFYISRHALRHALGIAIQNELPDLIYSGSLLRDGKKEAKILYRPLTINYLKRGQQPTSLQSCWFKNDVFKEVGKFNTDLDMRGGYELLCRMALTSRFSISSTSRVLSDYDLRSVTWKMVLVHFFETGKIIFSFFGLFPLLHWVFIQKDIKRFFKLWLGRLRIAFLGR